MSPSFERDSLCIHFTFGHHPAAVRPPPDARFSTPWILRWWLDEHVTARPHTHPIFATNRLVGCEVYSNLAFFF